MAKCVPTDRNPSDCTCPRVRLRGCTKRRLTARYASPASEPACTCERGKLLIYCLRPVKLSDLATLAARHTVCKVGSVGRWCSWAATLRKSRAWLYPIDLPDLIRDVCSFWGCERAPGGCEPPGAEKA